MFGLYLQHEVEVGDLLCRPARVIITNLKPGLHSLYVRALLEEVLIGAVVLQQVEQQQQTVLDHNTCTEEQELISKNNVKVKYLEKNLNRLSHVLYLHHYCPLL